jgi:Glycosyl hydrolase family 3 C-terminal domain
MGPCRVPVVSKADYRTGLFVREIAVGMHLLSVHQTSALHGAACLQWLPKRVPRWGCGMSEAMTSGKIRWGIAATGGIAARFARSLSLVEGSEIAAVASRTEQRGSQFADQFGIAHAEFPPEELERIGAICQSVPTVIDIHFERPAVLGTLVDDAAAIVANYGIAESALLDVLFGEALPEGNLPFDLPHSMEAAIESRSDVPFDTVDPVFRFGHGLRYATPE